MYFLIDAHASCFVFWLFLWFCLVLCCNSYYFFICFCDFFNLIVFVMKFNKLCYDLLGWKRVSP